MTWFSKLFSSKDEVTDGLSTLVLAAREDEQFRRQLLAALLAAPTLRDQLLVQLSAVCAQSQATRHFQKAFEKLKSESVRLAIIHELQERTSQERS